MQWECVPSSQSSSGRVISSREMPGISLAEAYGVGIIQKQAKRVFAQICDENTKRQDKLWNNETASVSSTEARHPIRTDILLY